MHTCASPSPPFPLSSLRRAATTALAAAGFAGTLLVTVPATSTAATVAAAAVAAAAAHLTAPTCRGAGCHGQGPGGRCGGAAHRVTALRDDGCVQDAHPHPPHRTACGTSRAEVTQGTGPSTSCAEWH
ncbi:hypothetical protein ACFQ2B_02845 [Streptomyces stramineus]